jgi:branched-chain amino acid aminotransferase
VNGIRSGRADRLVFGVVEPQTASIDGELMAIAEARIPVTDDGLQRGDGVFEMLRLYAGVPYATERHLARMAASAASIRLPIDTDALAEDIARLLAASAPPEDAALRLIVTRGGRRILIIEKLPDFPASMSLTCVIYSPVRLLDGVKSLSYAANVLAGRIARADGFDDALLVTPHGRVLEAPTSSFFWVKDGQLLTPPLEDRVLDSITRRLILDSIGGREAITTRDDLAGAAEAFLVSSLREVTPVHRIDGLDLPADGPVTRATAQEVAARIRADLG